MRSTGRDALDRLICFNLYLGWRRAQALYKEALDAGVNLQRLYLMSLLAVGEGRSMSSIARALELDLPSVSGLVGRMEREGLVERRPNPSNRAKVGLFLTPAGQERRDVVARRLETIDARLEETVGDEGIEALRGTVAALKA